MALVGAVFGSVVVPFGRAMYNINSTNWQPNPPSSSMFEKYGLAIRKFGISFEADPGRMPHNDRLCYVTDQKQT